MTVLGKNSPTTGIFTYKYLEFLVLPAIKAYPKDSRTEAFGAQVTVPQPPSDFSYSICLD